MRSSSSMSMSSYLWSLADIAWSVSLAWEYSEGRTNADEELQRAAAGDVQLLEQAAIAEDMPQEPQEDEQEIPGAMRKRLTDDAQEELQQLRAPPSSTSAATEPGVIAAEDENKDVEDIEDEMDEVEEAAISRAEEVEAEVDDREAEEEVKEETEEKRDEEKKAEEEEAEQDEASISREASEPELGSLPPQQEEAAETAPRMLERGGDLEAATMELREEREKTHLLQQQLEELQEDLNCTRVHLAKARAEGQEKEDEVKRLELECHSMLHLAKVPGPWNNFTILPGTGGHYEAKCHEEMIALKKHHKDNARVYEDKDASQAVKAMILFRVFLQHWWAEKESAQDEELKKAAEAREMSEARLIKRAEQEYWRNRELQEEAVILSRHITNLKRTAETNANDLKHLRDECPLQAAQIKELKNKVVQLEEDNRNLSGIDSFCNEVEAKRDELDEENEKLKAMNRKAKARLAESRRELAEAREELQAAKGRGDTAVKEVQEVREQLEGAEEENVLLKSLNDTLMGERDEARSAVANQRLQEQPNYSHWHASSPVRTTVPGLIGDAIPEPEESQSPYLLLSQGSPGPHDDLFRTSLTTLYAGC